MKKICTIEDATYVYLINIDWKMSSPKQQAQISNVALQLPRFIPTKDVPHE